jgi:hypothetical protein
MADNVTPGPWSRRRDLSGDGSGYTIGPDGRFTIETTLEGVGTPDLPPIAEMQSYAQAALGTDEWSVVAPAAAAGVCQAGWGTVVDAAASLAGGVSPADLFRAKAATTKLVLAWLEGDLWDPFLLADETVELRV